MNQNHQLLFPFIKTSIQLSLHKHRQKLPLNFIGSFLADRNFMFSSECYKIIFKISDLI